MLPRLLLAHKVPWWRFDDLLNRTEAQWFASPRALGRVLCEGPPCADCASVPSQKACAIDIELDAPLQLRNASTCWPKCRFTKAYPPELPAICWNGSAPAVAAAMASAPMVAAVTATAPAAAVATASGPAKVDGSLATAQAEIKWLTARLSAQQATLSQQADEIARLRRSGGEPPRLP